MPRILAIDSSLTATGLSRIDISNHGQAGENNTTIYHADIVTVTVGAPKPTKDKTKPALARRVNALIDQVDEAFDGVDIVGIENLAFSAGNSSAWVLAWVFGRCIELCAKHNVPVVTVGTSQVKKFALGKGSGPGTDKDHVLAAAIKTFPAANLSSNNEADSLWVGAAVAQYIDRPIVPVTKYRTEVIDKLGD
jgi:Holliday junction resolvasome RuvABC endonuclease subunit